MPKTKRRRSDRSGRPKMRSPGRPPVASREQQQQFWKRIAAGWTSEAAAVACGASAPVGTRWFGLSGGMRPISLSDPSSRYLSLAEREEIALLRTRGDSIRGIARALKRDPSTISRELRRNAATRAGGLEYRATTAQWHAERRARRPKVAKLAENARLRKYVQDGLAGKVRTGSGRSVSGPAVPAWKGRRHGRR